MCLYLHDSIMFVSKDGAYPSGALYGGPLKFKVSVVLKFPIVIHSNII